MREQGKEYFAAADPKQVLDETIFPLRESWEIKDAETLQKCEALRQTIKELSVDLGGAARVSPLAGGRRHAGTSAQYAADGSRMCTSANTVTLASTCTTTKIPCSGWDPPTHEEIPFGDASTAPRRFDQAAAKTLDLTDLLLPTDASELALPGTASYRPNTASS